MSTEIGPREILNYHEKRLNDAFQRLAEIAKQIHELQIETKNTRGRIDFGLSNSVQDVLKKHGEFVGLLKALEGKMDLELSKHDGRFDGGDKEYGRRLAALEESDRETRTRLRNMLWTVLGGVLLTILLGLGSIVKDHFTPDRPAAPARRDSRR
jgi:hypothetical protein